MTSPRTLLFDVDGVLIHGYHARPEKQVRWNENLLAALVDELVEPHVVAVRPGVVRHDDRALLPGLGGGLEGDHLVDQDRALGRRVAGEAADRCGR